MVFWGEDKCLPSEPVFIPRPNGESEDDGMNTSECGVQRRDIYSVFASIDKLKFRSIRRSTKIRPDLPPLICACNLC